MVSRLSLRTQLAIGAAILAIVAAIGMALVVGQVAKARVRADVGESLHAIAVQMAETLSRGMFERYRDITIAGSLSQMRDPAIAIDAKRALLDQLKSAFPDYAWIGLADMSGKVVASTDKILEGVDVSKRPWYQGGNTSVTVKDVHEAVLLAKLLPNPTGEPLRFVDVATPVQSLSGEPLGVLGAHLSWSWARDVSVALLKTRSAGLGLEILVLSHDGKVLMGPPDLYGDELKLASLAPKAQGDTESEVETWPDGKAYLSAQAESGSYLTYPGLGWRVVARQPVDLAFSAVREMEIYIALSGGVFVVLVAAAGWLGARHVSRPVLTLATAADHMVRGGNLADLPNVGGCQEVDRLSGSLHALLGKVAAREQSLTELNQTLEERVATRTEALARSNDDLLREAARRAQLEVEREKLIGELRELAATDPLTSALNRRAFIDVANRELGRAQRQRSQFAIIMMDIDHFKRVNDTYGHAVGDVVIKEAARLVQSRLRAVDVICRYGGEEFAILLIDSDPAHTGQLAERLRSGIEELEITTEAGTLKVTASFGFAVLTGDQLANARLDDILLRADKALYRAKGNGRNRVERDDTLSPTSAA